MDSAEKQRYQRDRACPRHQAAQKTEPHGGSRGNSRVILTRSKRGGHGSVSQGTRSSAHVAEHTFQLEAPAAGPRMTPKYLAMAHTRRINLSQGRRDLPREGRVKASSQVGATMHFSNIRCKSTSMLAMGKECPQIRAWATEAKDTPTSSAQTQTMSRKPSLSSRRRTAKSRAMANREPCKGQP